MKQLLVSLVLTVVMVSAVSAQNKRNYNSTPIVTWSGVDSLLISGADTVTSDTFDVFGYPYTTWLIKASQASDSVDINEVVFLQSVTDPTDRDETFDEIFDVTADTAHALLHTIISTSGFTAGKTVQFSRAHPWSNRGCVKVITGTDNGTNTRIRIIHGGGN